MRSGIIRAILVATIWLVASLPGIAEVRIAVAANFITTAEQLAAAYEADTGVDWALSHGASGALSAQIEHGAPFDIFLSADMERPAYLHDKGLAEEVRVYALGRLALVVPDGGAAAEFPQALAGKRVAIPDPALAPYGAAARAFLLGAGVIDVKAFTALSGDAKGDSVSGAGQVPIELVVAPNVSAAASYFAVGAVDAAFVAESLVTRIAAKRPLRQVEIARGGIQPIPQGMALLSDAAEARAAYDWITSPAAGRIIAAAGYDLPEHD